MHSWRRTRQTEHQAHLRKFLDRGKESLKRLKALKLGLEKSSATEVKQFFTEHSCDIFYVVYTSFTTLETNIQDKLAKSKGYNDLHSKDLLELVLPLLRQVLISLPELIHKKWQFNSICLILRKLLHPKNHMKLRYYGMQLLLLWVQALQENAGDSCMELFASAIPLFPPQKTPMGLPLSSSTTALASSGGLGDRYGVYSTDSPNPESLSGWGRAESQYRHSSPISSVNLLAREVVHPNLLIPMIPSGSDQPRPSITPTEELITCLLESLSRHAHWLHWDDPRQSLRGFAHLFFLIKLFYLACLYKDFQKDAGLYSTPLPPTLDFSSTSSDSSHCSEKLHSLLEEPSFQDRSSGSSTQPLASSSHSTASLRSKHKKINPYRLSSVIKLEYDLSNPVYNKVKSLILKYVLLWFQSSSQQQQQQQKGLDMMSGPWPPMPTVLPPREDQSPSGAELVRKMWFTSRDNVSLLLEICRQGFSHFTPIVQSRHVVDLYRTWYQATEKPPFMQSPPVQTVGQPSSSTSTPSLSSDSREALMQPGRRSPTMPEGSAPSVLSWEQLSRYRGFKAEGVEAGLNASMSMIVSHTQQVFDPSPDPDTGQDITAKTELCRKVIRLCQDMVVGSVLDKATWDFLLSVLLYHTCSVFTRKDGSLARELAAPLLKTLLVCFLRASGSVEVRAELWDNLLHVLRSLTNWQEVITQWKVAMLSMTEVLAQAVYGLSLRDLPLEVLSTTPHRKRVHSMERQGMTSTKPTNRQEPRGYLSSVFSDISVIQHVPRTRSLVRRITVDGVKRPQMLGQGDCKVHPSPVSSACLFPGGLDSIKERTGQGLTLVEEEGGKDAVGETSPKKDSGKSCDVPHETENEKVEVVIANPNVTSPVSNLTHTPGASQESLEASDIDSLPVQPLLSTPESYSGKKSLRSAATNLFKHRSPEAKQKKKARMNLDEGGRGSLTRYTPLLSYDDSYEATGVKSRRKKNHKRSGSDTTSHSVTKEGSPSSLVKNVVVHPEEEESNEGSSDQTGNSVGTPASIRKDTRMTLSIPKSASDGNLHLLSREPSLKGISDDSISHQEYSFRRVATIGSPMGMSETSSAQDLTVGADDSVASSTANMSMSLPSGGRGPQGKPSFQRSMTIDSPEPDKTMWHDDHAHFAPPISPTFGGGYSSSGWQREVAAITWLRMVKILGNVNRIKDDHIHAEAIGAIRDIWNALSNIRANSGISTNTDEPTPPLPKYMPPCELFLPWVVQACSPPSFHTPSTSRLQGRRMAYQLLCEMTIAHWHTPPSLAHLAHFYRLLHIALRSKSDMSAVAIRYGCFLYSYGLSGSSVLLLDCVEACDAILSSRDSTTPRNEALYMMGSLLYLPHLPLSVPSSSSRLTTADKELDADKLRERIVKIVYRAAVRERGRIARCIALYQVGILVFSELWTNSCTENVQKGLDILLSSLKFMDRGVSMCAIDMVSMLSEVAPQITSLYPSLPSRVIQAICFALAVFLTEDVDRGSWIEKVIITLLFLLRDWLMAVPFLPTDTSTSSSSSSPSLASISAPPPPPPPPQLPLPAGTIRTVFEVLQAATCSQQLLCSQTFTISDPIGEDFDVEPLETSGSRPSLGSRPGRFSYDKSTPEEPPPKGGDIKLSWERLNKSSHLFKEGRIQTAARSVVTHLLNLLGHFPFGCGAAQLCSSIKEYHDCPSLMHMDDLSPEIFDSPRIQFFAFGDEAVVTLVEIPAKLEGVPTEVMAGQYQTRVIVRDVTGKYAWDSSLLYGPQRSPFHGDNGSLTAADSFDSLVESVEAANCETPAPMESWGASQADPLMPPSWRTHVNSDRDVLQDLLEHMDQTSPECILEEKGHGLNKGVGQGLLGDEITLLRMLSNQDTSENKYNLDAIAQPCMLGEKSSAPPYDRNNMAFHHCRVFLSHLGLLSWDKRCHLDLLDKTSQLILELKNLDQLMAQSRATYKVAVLYVAPGQEDKAAILSNSSGSRCYEEFVAGLGWEVDMETHAGYMAGMQREFVSCSMPYYATSSEEVLFHVATRMTSKMEQKVRHLGNDEVHIVWSEHWRDYRRSLFRTQFADVLIILYPLSNGLIRVQMNKKPNVPQFGPLFNGAVVSRDTVAPLVRATAINALRAQRTPLVGYRGRYEERLRYIQSITRNKVLSTYEEFCENVMHPLEMGSSHTLPANHSLSAASRASPHKVASSTPAVSFTSLLRSIAVSSQHHPFPFSLASRQSHAMSAHSPHSNLSARQAESLSLSSAHATPRPRSSTNEDRIHQMPETQIRSPAQPWTNSVPDNLHNLTTVAQGMRSNTTPDLHASPRGARKKVLSHSLLKGHT